MKIAIQGHSTRGREVIKILENLGGKNIHELYGNGKNNVHYYHINSCGRIALSSKYDLCNYKFYTLEEFDKEFPFKIGDIVLFKGVNKPYEIIGLEWYMNKLCYKLDNGLHYAPETLTTYKEMEEERNITLTLDKAKEWYKKGGELKEIALQAFTEKELTKVDLPKTWEEFCANYPVKESEATLGWDACIINCTNIEGRRRGYKFKVIMPSRKSAEAHLAMMQLEQLRDCWRQGWKPTDCNTGYSITHYYEGYSILPFNFISFLSFPTKKMAEEFLECFKDLIEQTGDLI